MQYPRKIQIGFQEGTCPLRCKKCQAFGEHAKKKKAVKKMHLEKAIRLIDEISEMESIPAIQPSIYTEPFANEDLKEIIPYCRKKEVPLNIITNGILLDIEWIDLLIKCLERNSSISFSLDAVTQRTYEKVRGAYDLRKIEEKIEYLLNNRGSKGPRVSVNYVYEEDNYSEKDAFLQKCKDKVDAVRINVALDIHRQIPAIYRKKDVIIQSDECSFLCETMTIDSEGEVRVCPVDAFGATYLGNVFEKGIMPIWEGKELEALIQKHKENQLLQTDFCYGCEWGYGIYNFNKLEETEDYIIKIADYATYYNRKIQSR